MRGVGGIVAGVPGVATVTVPLECSPATMLGRSTAAGIRCDATVCGACSMGCVCSSANMHKHMYHYHLQSHISDKNMLFEVTSLNLKKI